MEGSFTAVDRRSVADAVHEQLRSAILSGALAPGEALPGERALVEQFSVNRHAVREAIKRLAQVGLVDVVHGGATRVRDWRSNAGLDVLADVALTEPTALVGALQMRRTIGVDVVRLAAARRAQLALPPLEDGAGLEAAATAYDALWVALVEASGNLAYRLALNSLQQAIHRMRAQFVELSRAEIEDRAAQADLLAAIAAGDADRAAALANALLSRTPEAAGA